MSALNLDKKKSLELLREKIAEGEVIQEGVSAVQTDSGFVSIVDQHQTWWQATIQLLEQLFDDEAVATRFIGQPYVLQRDRLLPEKITQFLQSASAAVARLSSIRADVERDLYPESSKVKTQYERTVDRLQDKKLIVIILISVAVLGGLLELIHKAYEVKHDVTAPHETETSNKQTVLFADMGIQAYFLNADSTVAETLGESAIESMIGDNRTIDAAGGQRFFTLIFTLSDQQLSNKGFKFNFSVAFYNHLGGNKAALDQWPSLELGEFNREFFWLLPLNRSLTFTVKYVGQ